MAKVTIRKDELDLVLETARRAAKRTNSVVVVAEDRVDLTEDAGVVGLRHLVVANP